MSLILQSLYFFLPAYVANMSPVLFKWIPGNYPIHERFLGQNKTWRGLIMGTLVGGLVFWLQKYAYSSGSQSLALIDYTDFSIVLGFLMGFGALLGDLVKSYYKRKQKIKPGHPWFFWDQLDFVIGALFLSFLLYVPAAEVVLVLFVASPILHIFFNHLGYWMKICERRW
jgi:CDP-2,3-bis-(O-geranylgeranyl)-sn-glycerol synthase